MEGQQEQVAIDVGQEERPEDILSRVHWEPIQLHFKNINYWVEVKKEKQWFWKWGRVKEKKPSSPEQEKKAKQERKKEEKEKKEDKKLQKEQKKEQKELKKQQRKREREEMKQRKKEEKERKEAEKQGAKKHDKKPLKETSWKQILFDMTGAVLLIALTVIRYL